MKFSNKHMIATLALGSTMVIGGCAESDQNKSISDRMDNATDQVEQQVDKTYDSIDAYVDAVEDRVDQIDDRLSKLEPKLDNVPEPVQQEIAVNKTKIDQLKGDLEVKLSDIRDSDVTQWDTLKSEADDLQNQIDKHYDNVVSLLEEELGEINFKS